MFESTDWFCGKNGSVMTTILQGNTSRINDPCFVDGYYLIVSAVFASLPLVVLLLLYSNSTLRNFNRVFIVRYPWHCARWMLGLVICHTQSASIMEGILTDVSTGANTSPEPHFYLPQTLALITVIVVLSYYHHMEVWNLWPMVFLPLTYWIMALSSEILRYLNIHEDPDAANYSMRWLLCLVNLIVYLMLVVIEIYTTLYLLLCPSGRPSDIGPIDLKRQGKNVKFVQGHTNFLSGILFWWMNDIVKLGTKRSLYPDDFGDLPRSLTAGPNATQFYKQMYDSDEKNMVTTQPSILRAYRSIYGIEFVESAFAKGISDALSFIPALAVGGMVDYVISNNENADIVKPRNTMEYITISDFLANGFVLLIISTLSVVIRGFFLQYSNYILFQQTIKIKGSLQCIIYDKSLRLSTTSLPESSCGVGEIANRVFVDTDNIQAMFTFIHNVWSIPVQVALSLMFLYMKMGVSALIGASIMLVIFPIQMALARISVFFQKRAMARSDERLRAINEVVQGMKLVKLLGWENLFYKIITKSRNLQVYMLRRQAAIASIVIPLGFVSPSFIALLSFSIYSLVEGMTLTPDVAFTVIPLIQNLIAPLLLLQPTINQVVGGIVSTRRIETFLASPEIEKNDVGRTNTDTFSTLVKNDILINEGNRMDEPEYKVVDHENTSFGQEAVAGSSYGSLNVGAGTRTLPEKVRATLPDDIVLRVTNGSFQWDVNSTEPILSDINIEIPRSRLTIIVGEVGSGKSSLLSAMLGEMYTTEGSVMWNTPYSSIAYSSQEAWLRNASLRDNIIFDSEYDSARYQQVIAACALLPDIQILPAGSMTEIGEKGINLSGGQRQRISVARSLYNDNQVVLLDDPMSALDVHVGAHVFENGIKKWLIGNKRTVILVTHQLQYLPFADQIIVMKNGRIQLQGTFEEVASHDKILYENWKKTMKEISETETEDEEDNKTKQERRKLKIQLKMSKSRQIVQKSTGTLATEDTDLGMTEFRDVAKSGLIEEEERNTGSVDKGLYLYYARMVGYAVTVFCLLAFVLETFLTIYSNVWLSLYTEKSVDAANKTQVFKAFIKNYRKVWIFFSFYRFFDTTPTGRILNRFSSDMQVLDQKMLNMLPFHIRTAMLVIGGLIVNAIVSYIFVIPIIPIALAYYFLLKYYLSASRDSKRIESITRSPVYSHFGETINGLDSVRAFQEQVPFLQRLVEKIDHNSTILLYQQVLTLWLSVRLSAVGSLIILSSGIATLIPGSLGYLDASLVGLAITYAISMSTFLSVIVQRMAQIETMMNAMERSQRWTSLDNEPQEGIVLPPSYWPHNGEISFDSMCVRYAPGLDTVLDDVNIDIKPGQKVGICGRTGSGKSSLTLALFRIIDTFRGKILIDGIDIAHIPLNSLRKRLAIIPQDPVLFTGTIRFNLDPDSFHSDKELWEALEIAQMKKVVADLGSGLDSPVFEGGENFSVGQRQLFCLARAFLIKTKVLVMDEATASIDVKTDAVLQEVVRRVFKDRTVLTIAHRVSTILDSDVIVVLSDGKVIEYDSPDRLLQRNSVFASLVKSNK
ncbi:ATP-binding cassette sub-family C member 8-like [Anneissia japonica]|uniref:ATP-binding cassette sub-family C member 8-like n=1 Tax=Anneissia japonica TaxID=1529436 RepID=UPI00142598C3|nr:ATP-binding cassette sub-family C member 8-like [Anneissia japonica]